MTDAERELMIMVSEGILSKARADLRQLMASPEWPDKKEWQAYVDHAKDWCDHLENLIAKVNVEK